MIDRGHDLSITKQAEVLKISRGSIYYLPRPVSSADLAIMRHLDRLHLEFPFAGSRMLRGLLALQGCEIGRRHVKTLMRRMGIEALCGLDALQRLVQRRLLRREVAEDADAERARVDEARLAVVGVVEHGFRSCFKDWRAEQTAYPNEMSEMALAHTVSDKVEAAYRRGDMRDKRRRMMADWATFATNQVVATRSQITPIRPGIFV
jgi:hypothetical protein